MSQNPRKSYPAIANTTSTEPSDRELVIRIQASDEQAFRQLYYRYYERLFRFVWRRIEDSDGAKDLMQTLFIRLWQNRERLDASQKLKPYLYQIAANLIIDFFRQKGQAQTLALEELQTDPNEEPEQSFELEEAIDNAVAALPEPLLEVYKLSRYRGLKNAEIARQLGISIKTVESRMTKAFDFLRGRLKPLLLAMLILSSMFE